VISSTEGRLVEGQAGFLEGWSLGAETAPALVAFSPSKRRKLSLTGTFDTAGMHAMLDGLFSGTKTTSPFQVPCPGIPLSLFRRG
jgi:hypothetical protein